MTNRYVCFWCDDEGIFNYVECETPTEVKVWFVKLVETGFYNVNIFDKGANKDYEG